MANFRGVVLLMALCLLALPAMAREQLRIVGSSTVFPFVAAAAEQFSRGGAFRTPIVEVNGTGGGFKLFCEGIGTRYPDIANASRPIKTSEINNCAKHGITDIDAFTLGYDGIVFANIQAGPAFKLKKRSIFLALARVVPKDGVLVPNFYKRWKEVDPALPDVPIEVYGPPPAEGTRDALVELVLDEACKEMPEYAAAYPDKAERAQHCGALREDGGYIDLLGGNLMVQKLINNKNALAIFSYSFLDQNRALVKANPVDGVRPTFANIVSQRYGVARSLFFYIKRAHLALVPGMSEFARFLLSDAASGEDGFLVLKGLIALPERERLAMQKKADSLN